MNRMKNFLIVSSCVVAFASCSPTKHLPPNDKLYTGATVTVTGPSLTTRERKELKEGLQGLTRPKPNSKVLGVPVKLMVYNMFYGAKKGLFKNLRDKFGQPPVLLSQVDLPANIKLLQTYSENKGYFHAQTTGDTVVRRKTASAHYKVNTGDRYHISSVHFPGDSSPLSMAMAKTAKNSLLKPGDPFDLEVIRGERTRLDAIMKEKGFYFFGPDYLLVKTDSSIGNHMVDMYLTLKPGTPTEAQQIYRINDVFIYSNYSLNTARRDTSMANSRFVNGYHIVDRKERFKPFVFEEAMQFRPGDIYNRTAHNQTLNRLINLNVFKFVKNRFEVVPGDSAKLDAYYYLTPLPPKTIHAEVSTVTRQNNLNGWQFNLGWKHRNILRSVVQANVTAYIGSDVQFSGAFSGYNTYRTGAEANLSIPLIVVPFQTLHVKGPYAPRTLIRLGYDVLNRAKLYTLNSYHFEYGYTWKKNLQRSHEFYPISVTYAQPLNVTPTYIKLQDSLVGLSHIIDQQFILGSRYEYLYNQQANGVQHLNSWYFDRNVDISGNVAGLLMGANVKKGDTAKLFGSPFSQYVKAEGDLRYYRRIGLKSTWANRIDIGVGIPYGNSTQLPYVKQFFEGGNNSLRGFRSRSVGPGTYFPKTTSGNPSSIIPDQTGDIRLEMNTEFRPHLSGPLYGAVFLEAGNIWLVNDSTYTQKPGSQFTSQFYKQLAVDAGVGLRLDITLFVIRFDVAFPLRKPWAIPPSVLRDINFTDPAWRRQNIVYNLAIGYPF